MEDYIKKLFYKECIPYLVNVKKAWLCLLQMMSVTYPFLQIAVQMKFLKYFFLPPIKYNY